MAKTHKQDFAKTDAAVSTILDNYINGNLETVRKTLQGLDVLTACDTVATVLQQLPATEHFHFRVLLKAWASR